MADIFQRIRRRPTQIRTVADRRLADAEYLRRSGRAAHANGAIYLGGFVLECLLKAQMLETHRWLQNPPPNLAKRSAGDRRLYVLCYQSHDLAAISEQLPRVARKLYDVDGTGRLHRSFKRLCGQWTVFARYSPRIAELSEAADFLDRIKELRPWLK